MSQHPRYPTEATVLIVEDHLAMRKIVRSVLYSIGIRDVVETADGAEAWNILERRNKKTRFDVSTILASSEEKLRPITFIVCDWIMPKMSGFELLQLIRADDKLKALPVMMLTAENTSAQIMRAAELGVTDYLIKPFSAAVLEAKLRAAMGFEL